MGSEVRSFHSIHEYNLFLKVFFFKLLNNKVPQFTAVKYTRKTFRKKFKHHKQKRCVSKPPNIDVLKTQNIVDL